MGQVCPASAPSQQYAPTNCQGVSTSVTNEKSKVQMRQPCVESRLISRGASCTQDDIRRSLRREKEMHISSPRPTSTLECNKGEECQPSKHRHSSRSFQNQSSERHKPAGQDSLRKKKQKDEERGGKITSKQQQHHQRHKQEQTEALQAVRDQYEEFQRTQHYDTTGRHHYHRTHVIHQKGSKLQVEAQNIAKQQVQTREQHQPQHHHHHHHRKVVEQTDTERHKQEQRRSKLSPHVEYSSQNEHNAKISARRTHVPNNSQSARSSLKVHKERSNRIEAVSPRSSLRGEHTKQKEGKEKPAKEEKRKSQRMRGIEDPVYSLPPIIK